MFNTVTLSKTLERGGLSREQADEIASGLYDSLKEHSDKLATKGDMRTMEAKLRTDFERTIHSQTKWLIGAMVALQTIGSAISKLFGH